MRYAVAVFALLAMAVLGCSVEDGDDMKRLVDMIKAMPSGTASRAYRRQANDNAYEVLVRDDPDGTIFTVLCSDDANEDWPEDVTQPVMSRKVTVREILECLEEGAEENLFMECALRFLRETRDFFAESGAKRPRCVTTPHIEAIGSPDWKPENVDPESIGRSLLEADVPPEWIAGLVVVTAAGVAIIAPEFLLALCVLSEGGDHWSCPGSPLYPPGETPQPGDDGGDR